MAKVLMTIEQFRRYQGVSRSSVYRWIKAGVIEAYRSPNGKHWYILFEVIRKGRRDEK